MALRAPVPTSAESPGSYRPKTAIGLIRAVRTGYHFGMMPSNGLVGICGIIGHGQPARLVAGRVGSKPWGSQASDLRRTIRTGGGVSYGQKMRAAFPAVPVRALRPSHAVTPATLEVKARSITACRGLIAFGRWRYARARSANGRAPRKEFCHLLVPDAPNQGQYVAVGRPPYQLSRASPSHFGVILQLIEEAARWLRDKNTDQWSRPWPDRHTRDERVWRDLDGGSTWIVWDAAVPAGTITVTAEDTRDPAGRYIWPERKRRQKALYVHRVIVSRSHAGLGLGAALIDWAAGAATRQIGAPRLRIDVWTTNRDLHAYYRSHGFRRGAWRLPWQLPGYPSRALFERTVTPEVSGNALFSVPEPPDSQRTCQ
jgi:GNAT superfamily N-acetyltransferase